MARIKFLTAGESHGLGLVGIMEGLPAGLTISEEEIYLELQRRQKGHGRGGRMKIESDRAQILSGVRFGETTGGPIALLVANKDWKNWQGKMSVEPIIQPVQKVTVPRPGHADLAGAIKYGHADIRNVLERASARETAMRVALGTIARKLLAEFDIKIVSHVVQIHSVKSEFSAVKAGKQDTCSGIRLDRINHLAEASPVRCLDDALSHKMMAVIDEAKKQKNTVGGVFEVIALNLPVGLGSYVHWHRKLDARLAQAVMSIPAIKGVEIGAGFESVGEFGSQVHDPIYYDQENQNYYRSRNSAGGLEGGVTNGMPLVVRAAMKPISTLMQPLDSVDMHTKEKTPAHIERSDVCAVPAASVIGEAVVALTLADVFAEKYGGDSLSEMQSNYQESRKRAHG